MTWLRETTGDPKSFEILGWESRRDSRNGLEDGLVIVVVKLRAKNQFGALVVGCRGCNLKNGKVVVTYDTKCPNYANPPRTAPHGASP
jgi:hypothetical protein